MKNINYKWTLLLIGMLFVFASCEDDHDSNPTLHNPTKFILNTPPYANGAVYDLENSSQIELTCSQPDYGFTAATIYAVQVSLNDDFTTEEQFVTLPSTYTTAKMAVDASEVAVAQTTLALNNGVSEEDFPLISQLYLRLKASLTNGEGEVYSNSVSLDKVRTTFALSPVVLPSVMNIVGSGIGDWNWANSLEMVPTYDNNGTFWHMIYCAADAQMKFNEVKDWDGNEFGSSATLEDNAGAGLSDDGGNLKVTNAGWYLVIVKATVEGRDVNYTVKFEKPNVYLLGAVMNDNWDTSDAQLFTVPSDGEGYFVSPAFLATGEVRMCVKIEEEEWWHSEFIVFGDGEISYRGTGGDQDRYTQGAGKRAYLNFMTGKGYYE